MIPRVIHPNRRHRRGGKFAFAPGDKARPLRIYVDGETVPDSPELEVLMRFAQHPEIEVIGTDDRFPNRLTVEPCGPAGQNGHPGLDNSSFHLDFEGGTRWSRGIVMGASTPEIGRRHASPGEEDRGARAMVMAVGASTHDSDAFVTNDPLLLERAPRNWLVGANVMSLREALAVVGLFLRSREDFAFDVTDTSRQEFDRGSFYDVIVRDLTPAGWRWFSGCVQNWAHTRDERLLLAGQTVFERIDRALRARDRTHENLQLPDSLDAATEAVLYFDVALFQLGGAFDSLAKVTHVAEGLGQISDRHIGWGRRDWMGRLAGVNPTLEQMMSVGHRQRDGRDLVAVLRNAIHQEILHTEMWHTRGRPDQRIIVPRDIDADLEALVLRAGTLDDFGLTRERDGRLHIEPGVYLEAIFPRVIESINEVMDATRVENLPGVDPAELRKGAPPDDPAFHPDLVERIRLLGGVG